ncbi:MAG: LuxR C-terminal-related transcriptional regulator [Chloroflexota bacterium]
MLRILIADDYHLFRVGLVHVLTGAGLQAAATVDNAEDALRACLEVCPDLAIVSPRLGGESSAGLVRRLLLAQPSLHVLVLSAAEQADDLYELLEAGARGYLLNNISGGELVQAIEHMYAQGAVLSPELLRPALDELAQLRRRACRQDPRLEQLTQRERQVLTCVARGLSNPEIGAELELSPHTVKSHLRRILEKLGFHTRSEAAAWCARYMN